MRLPELTFKEVSESISYDPNTGDFIWKETPSRRVKAGTAVGTFKSCRHRTTGQTKSYLYIRLKDREMVGSRVAWLLHHGEWPDRSVMFVDGNTRNLRIENLKLSHKTSIIVGPEGRVSRRLPKEIERGYALNRYYKLSISEYAEMYKDQNGVCAICKNPEAHKDKYGNVRVLAVDHCHTSGSVRKLLCYHCNSMLGQAKDNPDTLIAGAEYLRKYKATS